MKNYKILPMYEPWATLLVHGIKKIETRPKPTKWTIEKGSYLIHTAKKWSKEQAEICLSEPFKSKLIDIGCLYEYQNFPYLIGYKGFSFKFNHGCIIGVVDVVECCKIHKDVFDDVFLEYKDQEFNNYVDEPELSFGDYREGRYAWILENPRILETPIPHIGQQGYYQDFKGDVNQLIFK